MLDFQGFVVQAGREGTTPTDGKARELPMDGVAVDGFGAADPVLIPDLVQRVVGHEVHAQVRPADPRNAVNQSQGIDNATQDAFRWAGTLQGEQFTGDLGKRQGECLGLAAGDVDPIPVIGQHVGKKAAAPVPDLEEMITGFVLSQGDLCRIIGLGEFLEFV